MILTTQTVTAQTGERYILRTPLAEDAPAMLACMRATAAETEYVLSYPAEIAFTEAEEAAFLQNMAKSSNGAMLAAFCGETMVGSASITVLGSGKKVCHRAELGIALRQTAWGKGLGHRLLSEILNYARQTGFTQIELGVSAENTRAITLYQRMGFAEYGRLPGAFRLLDGHMADEILMVKPLQAF